MSGWKDRLLDLIYPPNCCCPLCNEESVLGGDGLCDACRAQLRRCKTPAYAPPLDGLAAGLCYDEPVRGAIHRLKYSEATYLAPFFARYMQPDPAWRFDCVVPVPLHPLKRYLRRYNQSALLARSLLLSGNAVPVREDLLARTRFTRSQTQVSAAMRRRHLQGVFRASTAARGLSILLVDDVVTTRSTLAACASALKAAGAVRVYAVCACDAEQS